MTDRDADSSIRAVEVTGAMGRHAGEALQLEIRRLAKQHGIEIAACRIDKAEETRGASA